MVVGRFQSPHRSTENIGHLLVFHFLVVLQVEHHALLFGQGEQRFLQGHLSFVARKVRIALQLLKGVGFGSVQRHGARRPLCVQESKAFVQGGAVEPGGEFGLCPELIPTAPCLDKGILKQVVGILMRKHHAPDLPV